MKDLTVYFPTKTTCVDPFYEQMGSEKFHAYLKRLTDKLLSMKERESIDILNPSEVRPQNIELFIVCCCYLMHCGYDGFQFNDTATKLTRTIILDPLRTLKREQK